MPRLHYVKKARKDWPSIGVKKGEGYYWWQFAFSGRSMSKTPPSRSQLTQSSFLSQLYGIQDGMSNRFQDTTWNDIEDMRQDLVDEIEGMRDECEDSLQNMPDHLQETSEAGEMLQERIDAMDNWSSELDCIDIEPEEKTDETLADVIEQITSTDCGL